MPDVSGELESLRSENARLRKLLKLTDAEAGAAHGTQTAWFDKSPGPVQATSSPQAKVEFYAALFGVRRDVYAIRWENVRSGKSGWVPAVAGGWRRGNKSADQHYLPLTHEVLASHLTGDVHIGLYPMLPGDQTCWLAAGASADRPRPVLVIHPTRFRLEEQVDLSIPGAIAGIHGALAADDTRNEQILTDLLEAHGRGRHCLVLAQRTAHVDYFAAKTVEHGLQPVVLKGGMGARERAAANERLVPRPGEPPLMVVATGHFVGEGFDCPALDTLFLAGPVSFKGRLVQYAGRILRAYPGKQTAEVHDYHDAEMPVLAAALAKRAPGYISLGFPDPRNQ